ncbi:CHAT domain-containing protein [Thermodesulfobacteriota bacterium]
MPKREQDATRNVNRRKFMASAPEKIMSIENELGLRFRRLKYTGQLAEALKQEDLNRTNVRVGMNATEQSLFNTKLGRFGTLVFATHGYFGKNLPGIQEPVLALTLVGQPPEREGFLTMTEVMNGLDLNADTVALVACQTGLGRRVSGEGSMNMGRAFQYAGARSVLMSLWSVAQRSSVDMVRSYLKHVKDGKPKLEAMQLARKEIREAGYDHPFFWAPFILVGEVR